MINLIEEATKDNLILGIDEYYQNAAYKDIFALCSMVQTLIIMEPGTYPNHPYMGIGIRNYKFEYLDSITLNSLQSRIQGQIDQYIPNNKITNVVIKAINNDVTNKQNTILVKLEFDNETEYRDSYGNTKDKPKIIKDAIISFLQVINTSKVVSKIYL